MDTWILLRKCNLSGPLAGEKRGLCFAARAAERLCHKGSILAWMCDFVQACCLAVLAYKAFKGGSEWCGEARRTVLWF